MTRGYRLWLAGIAGYLIGGVLSADIAARLHARVKRDAVDLRTVGSGNPGGANAFANLGKSWGAAVILGDIAKGAVGAHAGRLIAGDAGAYLAGTTVVLGHCFPATAGFKGGKGVATSGGTTLTCFPAYTAVDIATVAAGFVASKHAGKTTAASSSLFIVAAMLWKARGWKNGWGPRPTLGLPLYAVATSAIIAYKFLSAPAHMGDRER